MLFCLSLSCVTGTGDRFLKVLRRVTLAKYHTMWWLRTMFMHLCPLLISLGFGYWERDLCNSIEKTPQYQHPGDMFQWTNLLLQKNRSNVPISSWQDAFSAYVCALAYQSLSPVPGFVFVPRNDLFLNNFYFPRWSDSGPTGRIISYSKNIFLAITVRFEFGARTVSVILATKTKTLPQAPQSTRSALTAATKSSTLTPKTTIMQTRTLLLCLCFACHLGSAATTD